MEQKTVGAQTRRLRTCPSVLSFAAVGGRIEGEGPLREYFDELSEDHFFGEKTWEKGESTMQRHALSRALEKVGLKVSDLDLIFAGDLLNQCVGSSFSLRESRIPFYGLYGACSTMGESLSLAALMLDGGYASCAAALTSSHFCTAERQYRMPVPYGSQRTPTAQWPATGRGSIFRQVASPFTWSLCSWVTRMPSQSAGSSSTALRAAPVVRTPLPISTMRYRCPQRTTLLLPDEPE